MKGNIISESLLLRTYCLDNLLDIWKHLKTSLQMSEEELSFFISRCMFMFINVSMFIYYMHVFITIIIFQVSTDSPKCSQLLKKGLFPVIDQSQELRDSKHYELDNYERVWHQQIFQQCFLKFHEMVR